MEVEPPLMGVTTTGKMAVGIATVATHLRKRLSDQMDQSTIPIALPRVTLVRRLSGEGSLAMEHIWTAIATVLDANKFTYRRQCNLSLYDWCRLRGFTLCQKPTIHSDMNR
jgi:hypothetical protein